MPQFYHRHLGRSLSNQIWLLTHSDVLLREALDQGGFAVYHMLPASNGSGRNQLVPVARGESLDRAILDLVGEIASYQPDGKLVIFEGGGDTDFDVEMTCDLFPRLLGRVNTVSGSNKARVQELHRLLEKANADGALKLTVFSVVDRDSDKPQEGTPSRELVWDVYHIENYLLEPRFVHEALKDALRERNRLSSEADVDRALREAAAQAIDSVLRERLKRWADSQLIRCLAIGSDPRPELITQTLHDSVIGSRDRLNSVVNKELEPAAIEAKLGEIRQELDKDLKSGSWRRNLPGREILRRFAGQYGDGIEYEVLRNLIIARMRSAGFEPPGMKHVVDAILAG